MEFFGEFRTATFKSYLNPSRDGFGPFSNIGAIPLNTVFLFVYGISLQKIFSANIFVISTKNSFPDLFSSDCIVMSDRGGDIAKRSK